MIAQHPLSDKWRLFNLQTPQTVQTKIPEPPLVRTASYIEHATARPPRVMWLEDVYSLVDQNKNRKAIYILFKEINDLLSASRLDVCNGILHAVDMKRLNTSLMVALLSITLGADLPHREKIAQQIRAVLKNREPERVERLLKGLNA